MVLSILNELTADPFPSQLQKSTSYSSCQNSPHPASCMSIANGTEMQQVRMYLLEYKNGTSNQIFNGTYSPAMLLGLPSP